MPAQPQRTSFNQIAGNPYATSYQLTPEQAHAISFASPDQWSGQMNIMNQEAMNAQYMYDRSRDANNTGIYNSATGQNVQGPIDFPTAQQYVDPIRQNNQNANTNDFLNGGSLQVDPYGKIDTSLVQDFQNRRAKLSDNAATLKAAWEAQQPPPGRGFIKNSPIGNGIQQSMIPTLDPGTDGQTQQLQGGTNYNSQNPYNIGSADPAQVITALNNYQQNSNTLYGHQVTNAHYTRSDANDAIKAAAEAEKARKYQVFAPNGPAPNLESLYQSGQITQQQYLEAKKGAAGQQTIPTMAQQVYLHNLKGQAEPSNGFFGVGAHPGNPAAAAQYNGYGQKYGVAPITVPFGGNAKSNLQTGGFAGWKKAKK